MPIEEQTPLSHSKEVNHERIQNINYDYSNHLNKTYFKHQNRNIVNSSFIFLLLASSGG